MPCVFFFSTIAPRITAFGMSQQEQTPSQTKSIGLLATGGEMGERTRSFDWSNTNLGPIERWPQELKTIVRVMLDSRVCDVAGLGP